MNKIAIIPARSGSKGLKDKNIIDLCGKPLIEYTIESALRAKVFSRVIVSTESIKYGKIATACGAEFMKRPKELSLDNSSTFDVLKYILRTLEEEVDYFVLLQPTSPLRNEKHIIDACKQFEDNFEKFNYLVSVKEADHSEDLVKIIDEDMSLKHFNKDFSQYKRQDSIYYEPNGAIFIGKPNSYLKDKHFFGKKSMAFFMDKLHSVDIDDKIDLLVARAIIENEKEI